MTLLKVKPGQRVKLAEIDPADTGKIKDKDIAKEQIAANVKRLAELQEVLYAEGKHALLLVFQAMDTGGKDGAISRVLSGVNPQGVQVTSFKQPTEEELAHDFLWRVHQAVPRRGMIGVFNRSHYEDVLVVRVHSLVPEPVWRARYEHINAFESLLAGSGVTILKFYLHISQDEQKERLQARLDQPNKRWKFNPGDLGERALWDDYMRAYEDALQKCSTAAAPWYVVPANKKWYRDLLISETIVKTLNGLKMEYPKPAAGLETLVIP